jgi:UDPglucose 6-dehydrogenase
MRLDHRISSYFLNAGIGFGGNCLPKDTRALIAAARVLGCEAPLLEGIIEVNEKQPLKLVELAERKEGTLSQRKIAILGLAFKPGTDDIGEAPSLKVIEELLLRGAKVKVYDPAAMGKAAAIFGSMIEYAGSAREAVSDADMVFVLTEWDEFRDPELYRDKKVFEGRRIFSRGEINNGDCEGICW